MGSNPIFPAIYATIAQLAVQLTCNQEVGGSIPSGGTIYGEVCLVAMAPDCKSGTLETPVVRIRPSPPFLLGYSQAVRQQTLTLSLRWFESSYPSHLTR